MAAVLLSIHRRWCELIASGKKTVEVRKSRPKLETPFKCYIYCTKDGGCKGDRIHALGCDTVISCGKVIGELVCSEITEYPYEQFVYEGHLLPFGDLEKTCLDGIELYDYLGFGVGFGWHISGLLVYDKSKELSDFMTLRKSHVLERPPQSWCYVEELK